MKRGSTAITTTPAANDAELQDRGAAQRASDSPHRHVAEQALRPDQQHEQQDRERGGQPQLAADEVDVGARAG